MTEPFLNRWPWPAGTPITQEFGELFNPYPHRGRDAGCVTGTPIVAPCAGRVVSHTNDGSFGKSVCLDAGNGWYVLMAHNSSVIVSIGQKVEAGEMLALSGSTGMSTGPHCHLQICDSTTFPTDISHSIDPRSVLITEDDPLEKYRLSLIQIASGDYDRMNASYAQLLVAGYELPPPGADDLNGAIVRRFALIGLACGDKAKDAYATLGGA